MKAHPSCAPSRLNDAETLVPPLCEHLPCFHHSPYRSKDHRVGECVCPFGRSPGVLGASPSGRAVGPVLLKVATPSKLSTHFLDSKPRTADNRACNSIVPCPTGVTARSVKQVKVRPVAQGRVITISRNDLEGYRIPEGARVRSNGGVTAIMGVSNRRGAYAKYRRNLKIGPKTKVGGLPLRQKPKPAYAKEGATKAKHYAAPGYKYPVRTDRRKGESIEKWHERDRRWVRRALTRFGTHKHRYTPEMRKTIQCGIAKAAKAVKQDSPRAMEYRVACGLDKPAAKKTKRAKKVRKNAGGNMGLYFKSAGPLARRGRGKARGRFRANLSSLPRYDVPGIEESAATREFESGPTRKMRTSRKIGKKAPKWVPASVFEKAPTRRMADRPVGPRVRMKDAGIGKKAPLLAIAKKQRLERQVQKLRAENAALRGSPAASSPSKSASKKELEKELAKQRKINAKLRGESGTSKSKGASSMAGKKRNGKKAPSKKLTRRSGSKAYWAKVKAGKIKRKGFSLTKYRARHGKAASPAAAAKPRKRAAKKAPSKKLTRRSGSKAYWAKVKAGKIKRKGFSLTKYRARQGKAAKPAAAKRAGKKWSTTRKARAKEARMAREAARIMQTNRRRGRPRKRYASNKRRGGGFGLRRNAPIMNLLKGMVKPALAASGGYALHRVATAMASKLLGSFLTPGIASLLSAVGVFAAEVWATNKFLPKYAFHASIGAGLSTFGIGVKALVPDFATYAGFSGINDGSILPKYGYGEYLQAAAGGDPFLQAAAGEYYGINQSGTGEYFSQDLFPASGTEGEYGMSRLVVQGDTGAYEFSEQFSGGGGGGMGVTDNGIMPNADMDAQFNFMEAAAGLGQATRSDYIPHERMIPAGARSTNQEQGIFDQGGIFAG